MADLFRSEDVVRVLRNKFVVVIGDSVQRGVYKDLISLLQENRHLFEEELKKKGEFSHRNDELVEGGQLGKMTNGKDYREVRQFKTNYHLVRFYYVTRCYSRYMESVLADLIKDPKPDIIIMNSCLWDVSRYGPYSMPEYKKNLQRFFSRLNEEIPAETLFIWNTTLPICNKIKGGFLLDFLAFMQETLRLDIVEANFFAAQVVMDYDRDILDLHYNFRHLQHHRKRDGVHWNAVAHRHITQLLMAHICRAWGLGLPKYGRARSIIPAPAPRAEECYGGPIRRPSYMQRAPHQRSYSSNAGIYSGTQGQGPPAEWPATIPSFVGNFNGSTQLVSTAISASVEVLGVHHGTAFGEVEPSWQQHPVAGQQWLRQQRHHPYSLPSNRQQQWC